MATERPPASPDQILQMLTTEHFTLQTARAATIAEANGRSGLYLNVVGSGVVALAFIGQVTGMGEAFYAFACVLFPSLFFLGFVTFERAIQTSIENMIHARGINRIRHYYVEVAPETARYLILSTHDDTHGVLRGMGIPPSPWQHLVTNAGMVGGVNSILAGVFSGLAVGAVFEVSIGVRVGVGAAVCVLAFIGHRLWQNARYTRSEMELDILFPSPAPPDTEAQ